MIEVGLRIERDIERLNKSLGEGWTDTTAVKIYVADVLVEDGFEARHVSREQVLLDFLAEIGYNVQIEETLVVEDE